VKTFLNWTMPEFVNISVGSLRGTSGEDATASWPVADEEVEEGRADVGERGHGGVLSAAVEG
jgi:hypothetical protein